MALTPGTRLGVYEIIAPIGEGGMGQVFRARDTKLDRDVAIKILPEAFAHNADRLARLTREAKTLASLNHPKIAGIYGLEEGGGVSALVMELVEGEDLSQRIRRGAIPSDEALPIAKQIAEALEAAHEQGIIHRDLKPANIKLRPDGTVKVLDFGLAKVGEPTNAVSTGASTSPTITAAMTDPGIVLGTTAYMSPEQARGLGVDKRTDIWAFGCVLYEMLTGKRAFRGQHVSDTLVAILRDEPDESALPANTPTAARKLLRRCLEKERGRRWQSAGEVRQEIEDATGAHAARSWRFPVYAVLGALILVGLTTAWWLRTGTRSIDPVSPASMDVTAGTSRLVVLPFENLTRQAADDWLSGALSDSLTFGLQNLRSVILVNREPVTELYRQESVREVEPLTPQFLRRLTELLNVQYYVRGSYQKVGERIRVVAQLIDATNGAVMAQQSLTDRFENIFQIEDELTRRFAGALEVDGQPSPSDTTSLDAYRLYSEARSAYAASTRAYTEARDKLREAVARDPQYAQAWALLGKLNARLAAVANFRGGSVSELRAEALAAAHHAIALKPSLYDARIAQALASRENDDTAEWRKQADAAIRINPRLAEGYALLADSYLAIPVHGCARDVNAPLAEEFYRRALLIDPRFGPAYANLSAQLGYAARPDDALRVAEEGLALLPNYISLHTWRAESLLQLNRLNDAELALQPIARLRTPSAVDLSTLMFLDLRRGNLAGAKDRLNLILSTRVDKRSEPTYLIFAGAHYFDAGDPGEAISVLDRAFTLEAACARRVAETPRFARHRAVAAFGALLAKFHGK